MKSGSLNLLEPQGPVQACNGIAEPFLPTFTLNEWALCLLFLLNIKILYSGGWWRSTRCTQWVQVQLQIINYYVDIKCQLDTTDEFLLQILLLAQHVSGTIMSIIRSSRVLYKWLLPVVFGAWFSSCRYGVELRVVCPVCGLLRNSLQTRHTTLRSKPYRQLENQAPNMTGSNKFYNTLELLMMDIMVPETCWQAIRPAIKKSSVAFSWHFISTY